MKSRIKSKKECTKVFYVEIPHEDVQRTVDKVYEGIRKIAKIPGFREGTAPRDLLEKQYSKDANEEVLKRLIPEGYRKALEDHAVDPIGFPKISNVFFEKEKPLTFEVQVDTRPNFKLRSYKGIRVKKKRISVSTEEIDNTIKRLQGMYADYKDVAGPLKKDQYAVCNVEAFIDEKPISKPHKSMWIQANKEASLLGLGEKLIGFEKGITKDIDTTLPENYPDKKYAGKAAIFKVTINEIKEKETPLLNDEFAKKLKSENMDTNKKTIESELFARKENNLKVDMKNQLLDKLLKDNKFTVPEGLVEDQKGHLKKRLESELLRQGLKKEDIDKRIKDFDTNIAKDALDKVRSYFILDKVAEQEKINASEEDLKNNLEGIAASCSQTSEEVRKYYEKENLIGGLKEEIKETKVLDFLLKNADIVDEK